MKTPAQRASAEKRRLWRITAKATRGAEPVAAREHFGRSAFPHREFCLPIQTNLAECEVKYSPNGVEHNHAMQPIERSISDRK
jgi:hypothetical protein